MKKFKILFISLAVVAGVGGAFATTRVKAPCEYMTQYRLVNGTYVLAGEFAVDYYCMGTLGVCTYYKPWPSSNYIPCKSGVYVPFDE